MKFRHVILLAITIGAVLSWFIKEQRGFVIIAWDHYSIELRLWLAIVFFLLLVISIFVLCWLVLSLSQTSRAFGRWSRNRGSKKSRSHTINGLITLTEGHWQKAEQYFKKAIERSDSPLMNYLLAAKSAHEQKDYHRRDNYLKDAAIYEPDAHIAVSVTQAELQYESGQYEQALATLRQLWAQSTRHPYVLKLLCKCYVQLKDWKQLYPLLPELKKQQVLESSTFKDLERKCVQQGLLLSANLGAEMLQQNWLQLASHHQKDPENIAVFCEYLIAKGAFAEAESYLRQALKRGYQRNLIYWYGFAAGRDNQSQLQFAESFKQEGSADAEFHMAVGQLSFRNELWGKAKAALTRSLSLKESIEAYHFLILTQESAGDPEHSIIETLRKSQQFCMRQKHPNLQHVSRSTTPLSIE